jgi:hypothetical protein
LSLRGPQIALSRGAFPRPGNHFAFNDIYIGRGGAGIHESRMDERLVNDLGISHAFINALSACYQGSFVFINALEQLAPTSDGPQAVENAGKSIQAVNRLWEEFKTHRPLVVMAERDKPSELMRAAWEMLVIAKRQLKRGVGELARSSLLERNMADRGAFHFRVAASCEAAYARYHYIQGLVFYGEVMNREEVSDRWRQHLLSCQGEINEAHQHLGLAKEMGANLVEETVARILDDTLGLPAGYGARVNDINVLFAKYRGQIGYGDVEIPDDQAASWAEKGIPPEQAGSWFQGGFTVEETMAWVGAGVPDPIIAFNYLLRNVPMDEAVTWMRAGFSARDAARFRNQGLTPEQARKM